MCECINNIRLGPRRETQEELNERVRKFALELQKQLEDITMVRCKFVCQSKREFMSDKDKCYDYEFSAVYGAANDASDENKKFWKYTPSGKLNVATVNDGQFIPGKEYYLDLSDVVTT